VKHQTAALLLALLAGCATPQRSPDEAELAARDCLGCHAIGPGENNAGAPTLFAIVGRPIAAEPGFNYSPALRRLGAAQGRWSPELLDRFLTDPDRTAPGNEMGYAGLRDRRRRQALIGWLSDLRHPS
jgi:cytochrome c